MDSKSQQPKPEQEDPLQALNAAIKAMDIAKELSTITPAMHIFGSVSVTLTMLRVRSF